MPCDVKHAVHFGDVNGVKASARRLISGPIVQLVFCIASGSVLWADSTNWALNRTYELSPSPNYALCTDPGDGSQLTDGQSSGCDWRKKSTVGWRSPAGSPYVVIDLGAVRPIDAVRVHTVGGGRSGVFFPAYLWVGVGDDGRAFTPAGWAATLDRPQDRTRGPAAPRLSEVIEIATPGSRGRFVAIALEANSDYAFADEIEVLGGDGRATHAAKPGGVQYGRHEFEKAIDHVRRRAFVEADFLMSCAQTAAIRDQGDTLPLDELRKRMSSTSLGDDAGLQQLAGTLASTRGRLLHGLTNQPWVAWTGHPMSPLSPTEFRFAGNQIEGRLALSCWQGEYESGVVNIANTSDRELLVRADVSALKLKDGTILPPSSYATLRYAVWVESRAVGRAADALVKLTDEGFRLFPGQVTQLWLTIDADSIPAGSYDFAVRILGASPADWSEAVARIVPGLLEVEPLQMPDLLAVSSCNWAYVGHTRTLKPASAEAVWDLTAHYTDTFVTHRSSLPNPDAVLNGRADYTRLDDELKRFHNARNLLLFWGLGSGNRTLPSLGAVGSEQWKAKTTRWVRDWIGHLKQSGWTYDRFIMYPYDEYIGPEFLAFAKLIKEEIDPNVRLFANHRGKDGSRELEAIAPYIDVWCLPDRHVSRMQPPIRSARPGVQFWTYSTDGPGKGNPVYSYYRLQPWRAFARGESGCGFWTYSDAMEPESATAWDDYSKPQGWYSVIYGEAGCPVSAGGEKIIPSRRWEAWREGLEDFQYLRTLQMEVERARQRGIPSKLVRECENRLESTVQNVLGDPHRPEKIDIERKALSEAIKALQQAMGARSP